MADKQKFQTAWSRTLGLGFVPILALMVLTSCQVVEDVTDNITDFVNDRYFNQKGKEPIADAGPDRTALVGQQVVLDGSGSRDPNSDTLGFIWSISSQPAGSTATLAGTNDVRPSFTPDRPGDYVITLIVTDGHFNSTPVAITVTALLPGDAAAPFANAGPDQVVATNSTVTLNGSASGDVNGDTITFAWTIISAPVGSTAALANATTAFPTFVPNIGGDYIIQLVVSDGIFTSAVDLVTVTANTGPVANAGADQTAQVGQVVILNGSGSADSDGDPLSFRWTIDRKPSSSTALLDNVLNVFASFVADVAGTYIIRLTVTDPSGQTASDTMILTATAVPTTSLPVANAGADQVVPLGTTVFLDGTGSSDPNNDPLTFQWTLTPPTGSGAILFNSTSPTPNFTVDVVGIYFIELVVSDGTNFSQPDTVIVTTSSPTANITVTPATTVSTGTAVVLDGTGSVDLQGDTLTFAWSFQTVPATSSATLSGTAIAIASFTPDVAGQYVVQLIVSDGPNQGVATVIITAL